MSTESRESKQAGESGEPIANREAALGRLGIAVLLALTAAVYLTTVNYEYSWDDELFLKHSPRIADLSNFWDAFSTDFWGMTDSPTHPAGSPLYRPLALGALILERSMFGDRPVLFRLFHLLIHLGNILLAFVFTKKIIGGSSPLGPMLAAASFAAMPYTVDTVLFLTCISDLLATLFAITALICFVGWIDRAGGASLVGFTAACAAAVLSKESAVSIPLMLGAVYWCRGVSESPRRAIVAAGVSMMVVAAFMGIRAQVVGPGLPGDILAFIKWLPSDLALAFRWCLAPFPLVLEQDAPRSFTAAEWWLGLAGIAALVAAGILKGRRWSVALGGMGVWIAAMAPSLVALQWTGVFAPRYLYMPTIGLALTLGFLGSARSKVVGIALSVFLSACGFLSLSRTTDWNDSVTLWVMEMNNRPKSTSALINLGAILARRGDFEQALPIQLKAAKIAQEQNQDCSAAFAFSNAATILAGKLGDQERALQYFEKCVSLCPGKAQNAWMGIAQIHMSRGDWTAAEGAARKAEELGTQKVKIFSMLGAILTAQGRYDEAVSYLTKARELASTNPVMLDVIDNQLNIIRNITQNIE